jgi:hypothetical protein
MMRLAAMGHQLPSSVSLLDWRLGEVKQSLKDVSAVT